MMKFAVHAAENSAASRRLRDRRFASFSSALSAAEDAAVETSEAAIVEEYDADGRTSRTWTVRHDAQVPTEADANR